MGGQHSPIRPQAAEGDNEEGHTPTKKTSSPTRSPTRLALRTEEDQEEAARERAREAEIARKDARRKSLGWSSAGSDVIKLLLTIAKKLLVGFPLRQKPPFTLGTSLKCLKTRPHPRLRPTRPDEHQGWLGRHMQLENLPCLPLTLRSRHRHRRNKQRKCRFQALQHISEIYIKRSDAVVPQYHL